MGQIGDHNNDNITSNLQIRHDIDIENKESQKKHKCNYPNCNAVFLRPNRLERHMRSHTGERPYKCSYLGCTKSYTNSSHLKRHLETHNSVKKIYKCTECSMLISTFHNMKRHNKRMHSNKKISCKECGETFNKKHHLIQHKIVQHSASMTYKCDKCTKSYMTLARLNQHQKIHEKRYSCSKCSEEFENLRLLRVHTKTKHINYKCDTCGKVFANKCNLKKHSKTHSEDRLVLLCPYDNCHRTYFFKSNLAQHVRTNHLGEKFYCDICSMGFVSKNKLIKHIQRHYKPTEEESQKRKRNKIQRKKRKDAGIPRKSMLTSLIGITLPNHLEKMVMERETKINDTTTLEESR